jgi:Cu-processing system permease protein
MLISVWARDRVRASGTALALWFFFVLVFDLLLMGALVASQGGISSGVFAALLMLNPADVFRLLNVFSSDQAQGMYGLATVSAIRLDPSGRTGVGDAGLDAAAVISLTGDFHDSPRT